MRIGLICILLFIGFYSVARLKDQVVWGFFGHKLINRLAVFTLPEPMIEFYKAHLDYIVEHSVDPDKRRYAVKTEAICHFIDLDKWIEENHSLPDKDLLKAFIRNNAIYLTSRDSKVLLFDTLFTVSKNTDSLFYSKKMLESGLVVESGIELNDFYQVLKQRDFNFFNGDEWIFPSYYFETIFPWIHVEDQIEIVDHFSVHGILPYNLERCFYRLVKAFQTKNVSAILRGSAELGHYIGDAHVPLHTTMNYNGQLTNQHGIHAFWESRIPELFAVETFDFVVGKAEYISDVRERIWDIIVESHKGVAFVLDMEFKLNSVTPDDEKFCYDTRLNTVIKTQCKEYAKRYMDLLDNQVEERMRESIFALGSFWMTAWYEAGQPDLNALIADSNNLTFDLQDSVIFNKALIIDRDHE